MTQDITILYPGGFKPLHGGHVDFIRRYAQLDEVREVILFIGQTKRDRINQDIACSVAEIITKGIKKVRVMKVTDPTPVTALYNFMRTAPAGRYAVVASNKGDDTKKVEKFLRDFNPSGKYNRIEDGILPVELNVDAEPLLYSKRGDEYDGLPISSTIVRSDVESGNLRGFLASYPSINRMNAMTAWVVLINAYGISLNLHMEHLEDLIYVAGDLGPVWAQRILERGFAHLYRGERGNERFTVKYDGAPAVFMWSKFPGLPDYGVAIKSLFNKSRKIVHDVASLREHFGNVGPLYEKMVGLLSHSMLINIPEGQIWQGDLMFDRNSVRCMMIGGKDYLTFTPNTICYAVGNEHPERPMMEVADLGIAWHTRYTGDCIDEVTASYDVSRDELRRVQSVYYFDHQYDAPRLPSLNMMFYGIIMQEVKNKVWQLIEIDKNYPTIVSDERFVYIMKMYDNSLVRIGKKPNYDEYFNGMIEFVESMKTSGLHLLKTDAGRAKLVEKYDAICEFIRSNRQTLSTMRYVRNQITLLKLAAIASMNKDQKIKTFFRLIDGSYKETNHEGYAFSCDGAIVKLVDRYEFSRANFSNDIIKGWN